MGDDQFDDVSSEKQNEEPLPVGFQRRSISQGARSDRLDQRSKAVISQLENLSGTISGKRNAIRIGKYDVIREIGHGGQSKAYLAYDPDLRRQVVLKIYRSDLESSAREAVLHEGRTLSQIRSRHVVRCYAVEKLSDAPYLVLECVSGTSLSERLHDGPLEIEHFIPMAAQIADGLADVHRAGLIHRDVKPGNIIIDNDGIPKLIDFGLSVTTNDTAETALRGTPTYMPPEQARGEWQRLDYRADVFSLGAVFYEMLAGVPIYRGEDREQIRRLAQRGTITPLDELAPGTPPTIANLCMQCLSKEPGQRPDSAAEIAAVLRACESDKRTTRQSRQPAFVRSISIAIAIMLLVSSVLLIGNRLGYLQWLPNSSEAENSSAADRSLIDLLEWERIHRILSNRPSASKAELGLRDDFSIEFLLEGHPQNLPQPLVLHDQDDLRISLSSERSCYFVVFSIGFDSNGKRLKTSLVFPNSGENNYAKANTRLEIPELVAESGMGLELFYVIASTTPVPAELLEDEQIRARNLQRWVDDLRDVRRKHRFSEQIITYRVFSRLDSD